MKTTLVLGAVALTGAAVMGCGGGDTSSNTTGSSQNTGGSGGNHVAGSGGTGGDGTGASNPGVGGNGGSASTSTSTSSSSGGSTPGQCKIFPDDNWWNTDISSAAVDGNSDNYVKYINANGGPRSKGAADPLHADFDSGGDGIPFNLVDSSVTKVSVTFGYADQSDVGPYPIPANPKEEDGSDGHVLLVDTSECKLYEMGNVSHDGDGWHAGAGAIWDLTTDKLRHDCWTSADAAGLPIYPGLVRFDEVTAGAIKHALRFTVNDTQQAWIKPARHEASSDLSPNAPPMGLRFRLKSNAHVNGILSGAAAQPKVVLVALQKYGMIVADNGSNWYVSGEPNPGWDDDGFHGAFDQLHGDDFEVIKPTDPIELHSDPSCRD